MAAAALTGGRDLVPTGFSPEMSRRQIFSGAARATATVAAVALAPAAVAAATAPAIGTESAIRRRAREAREKNSAKFWDAHRRLQILNAEFAADQDESWENWDRWMERIGAVETEMCLLPAYSAAAVLAKLSITDDPRSYPLPGATDNLAQMITWDLERMAGLEITGLANVENR